MIIIKKKMYDSTENQYIYKYEIRYKNSKMKLNTIGIL